MIPLLPRTIKAKMALVVVIVVAALGFLVAYLSINTYRNYRMLLLSECRSQIRREKERTNQDIQNLQDNAQELALIGELQYRERDGIRDFDAFGSYAVVQNFQIDTLAVGGGIWFAPYTIDPERELACFYAYNDDEVVRHEPRFETAEYHYPSQSWYTSIWAQVEKGQRVAWTPPYFDDAGTLSLMTTAGCGIYDKNGTMVGLSTVDWQLEAISRSMSSIRPTPNSFALFADLEDDFILADSDPGRPGDIVGRSLSDLPWYAETPMEESILEYRGVRHISFRNLLDNGMIFVVNIPEDELYHDINRDFHRMILMLAAVGLATTIAVYAMLNRFINRPVAYLSRKAKEIGDGNLDVEIALHSNDELGRFGGTLGAMAANLRDHIRDLKAVTTEKERIGAELDIAREIQSSMLPSIFPPFPDREEIDIFASMLPAKEVGGDFYDFFMVGRDRVAVIIADVSGKGVPAALFMVIAKTLIRNHAQMDLITTEVFNRTNAQLCENNQVGMFVTAFMGILDVSTGIMEFVNAGHNPPVLIKENGTAAFLSVQPGFVLGGIETIRYQPGRMRLNRGDCLYLYTDGVTEAMNAEGGEFGNDRLIASVNRRISDDTLDLKNLLDGVKQDVDAFAGGTPQFDDITMLGIVYSGMKGEP